ncbi:CLUMA_CG012729, isoform A [Clunio marinus]|uniref:CLUMA_CG012729, isoform A n=1 Tax=Clunio marinus TaxID=568069 RepID=A0A1J1IK24_9DIPT|nr:CLUMA_CG012729, isoform A [Clunio marinus]
MFVKDEEKWNDGFTGKLNKHQIPPILVLDLNTNQLIGRFEIPVNQYDEIVPERCDEAFTYILDMYAYGTIIYDFKQARTLSVVRNYILCF